MSTNVTGSHGPRLLLPRIRTTEALWMVPPANLTEVRKLATLQVAPVPVVQKTHTWATGCWSFSPDLILPDGQCRSLLFGSGSTVLFVQ